MAIVGTVCQKMKGRYMLKVSALNLGFSDAENYRRREQKDFLNKIFFDDNIMSRILSQHISFLIGEKGTGKTTYATYISNNCLNDTKANLTFLRETDFQKFMVLKQEKGLFLSDYVSIWKVILFLLFSQFVYEKEGSGLFARFSKIKLLKQAIDEYYAGAFSPEITQAIEFVRDTSTSVELITTNIKAEAGDKNQTKVFSTRFQNCLFYIKKQFEDAFMQMRPDNNYILFLDGIDIRPNKINYDDYLDCIKGLATAVWELNNDFFPKIKGKKGRFRCILLLRPDIFANLGLQNQNTKLENSVLLDWKTEYLNYASSNLYKMMNKLLSSQQTDENKQQNLIWEKYFPWQASYKDPAISETSFIDFLRISYYRPRDFIKMLNILRDITLRKEPSAQVFSQEIFFSDEFRKIYSDYLLGEIKDQLTFYFSEKEYDAFVNFFIYLNGKSSFKYGEFLEAYKTFEKETIVGIPTFMNNPDKFLQFLYDLNVICYKELIEGTDTPFVRWCFRERSYANVSPKIRLYEEYEVFPGLKKALNLGKKMQRRKE